MKIIQLVYGLGPGGAERVVVDIANALSQRGHEVIVCAILDTLILNRLGFNRDNLLNEVRYVNLGLKMGFSICNLKKIEEYIKLETPDIIHCHLNNIPYVFRILLRHSNLKCIYTLHNIASKASGPFIQIPINWFYFKTHKIIPVTISEECHKSFKSLYHLECDYCIPNGRSQIYKTKQFDFVKQEIEQMKQDSNTLVFIHVARYYPQKNQKMLIEVFNELDRRKFNFILLVIGAKFDLPETEQIRERACNKIYFYGHKKNIVDYLYCSDAFCLTSSFEGLPISLLEALSCGCVPICTPVGGIPDIIQDGKWGIMSKEVTFDSYIDAVDEFYNNRHRITRDELKTYFEENYSMDRCVDKYLEVYTQC